MNKKIICAASFLVSVCYASDTVDWKYVDFHRSMKTREFTKSIAVTKQVVGLKGLDLLKLFKKLYDQNNPSKVKKEDKLKIPKIIHQIWLGSPLPEAFKKLTDSWIEKHRGRGWKYKLWTDEDVEAFDMVNKEFYDKTTNYGVKSDLLKWEIVHRYGGVYIDMDFECLKAIDDLHYVYDFYTGIQPLDTQYLQLGAAIFGAVPGHPILKHCIDSIKDDWHKNGAPAKSGPIHFTKSFFATAGKTDGMIDIAFPAHYFYPQGSTEKELLYDAWINQGAWAIHHWAKSWMPKQYRRKEFRDLNNDHLVQTWRE